MSRSSDESGRSRCLNCGFETGSDGWDVVEAPPFGELAQCPECGSTDVTTL